MTFFIKSRYVSLLGAFLIHLSLGNFSSSGNLIPYVASYMRRFVDPTIGQAEVQWIGSAGQVAFGFCSILGGKMEQALGTRLACSIGSLILSGCLLLSYSTVQTSLPLLVVTYGFGVGLGTTLPFGVTMYAAMEGFPRHPGLVSGIILCGYYIGDMSAMLLQMAFLNPNNLQANNEGYFEDEALLTRVPSLFVWMAGISAALQVCGVACISRPWLSEVSGYRSRHEVTVDVQALGDEQAPALCAVFPHLFSDAHLRREGGFLAKHFAFVEVPPGEVIRHRVFRLLWATYFLNSFVAVSIITTFKSFGGTFIYDDNFLTYTGCMGAMTMAFGAICWGYIMDRFSYKPTMIAITTAMSLFVGTLPVAKHIGRVAYVIWGMSIYFIIAGTAAVMPTIVEKLYGAVHATKNIGVLYVGKGVAALLVAVGMEMLLISLDYSGCYACETIITGLALVCTLMLPEDLD